MHKRPSLSEAIQVLTKLAPINEECNEALTEYYSLKAQGHEFFAARIAVEIVDHYYHVLSTKGLAHG
jgi:hypothetical protein